MEKLTLTEPQQKALDFCLNNLEKGEDAAIVGYAGTGKTATATELIHYLPNDCDIIYLALTNKAAQVIERMLAYKGLSAQCSVSTIHRFLKLNKQFIDPKTGKRTFKKSKTSWKDDPEDWTKQRLIVDEMGCIPNNEESPLVYELLQLPQQKLLMGDPCQLPPVNEEIGLLFELMEDATVYLDQVVRYSGPILEAATHLRNNIKSYDACSVLSNENDGDKGIFKVPGRGLKQHLTKLVKREEFDLDKDFLKVITWTNEAMNYWNSLIKTLIYGGLESTQRWIEGQRIVCLESAITKEEVSNGHSRYERTVKLMSASEEGVVLEIHLGQCGLPEFITCGLSTYFLDVRTEYGSYVTLHVIHEDSEAKLSSILKDLAKKKDWNLYWKLKDWYHQVNDAYSLTIQRMQGSTCRYVVLDTDNFNSCKNIWRRNRMFYTGLTRATDRVYL